MNLLCLAQELQEQILLLAPTERGRDTVTERQLRPIAGTPSWRKQRKMWADLLSFWLRARAGLRPRESDCGARRWFRPPRRTANRNLRRM